MPWTLVPPAKIFHADASKICEISADNLVSVVLGTPVSRANANPELNSQLLRLMRSGDGADAVSRRSVLVIHDVRHGQNVRN